MGEERPQCIEDHGLPRRDPAEEDDQGVAADLVVGEPLAVGPRQRLSQQSRPAATPALGVYRRLQEVVEGRHGVAGPCADVGRPRVVGERSLESVVPGAEGGLGAVGGPNRLDDGRSGPEDAGRRYVADGETDQVAARSLESMAQLNIAKSRRRPWVLSCWRIAQICLGFSGALGPMIRPAFQGFFGTRNTSAPRP